jgi:hypothetical protein
MKVKLILLSFITTLLIISCSTQKLRVEPVSDITYWDQGREFIVQSENNVEIALCLDSAQPRNLVFFTNITNHNTNSIEVKPELFYYLYQITGIRDTTQKIENRVYARNPENEIEQIDERIDQEENSYAVSSTLGATATCLGCIGDFASLFSGDSELSEENLDDDEYEYDWEQEKLEHEQRVAGLEEGKGYWKNEALRRTTLFMGESAAGLIEFPAIRNASMITLHFPVDSTVLHFDFKQRLITL